MDGGAAVNIDLSEEEKRGVCLCCYEANPTLRDADVGPVCSECFTNLLTVFYRLQSATRVWLAHKDDGSEA